MPCCLCLHERFRVSNANTDNLTTSTNTSPNIAHTSPRAQTSLMQQYVHSKFNTSYKATIGADFLSKDLTIDNNKPVTLQIWDTAGQERFQSLGIAFYRGADACILCYDLTDRKSFESLQTWQDEFKIHVGNNATDTTTKFPFVVLGNKSDICNANPTKRQVNASTVKQWCLQHNDIPCYETSAKDASNVQLAFETVARNALAVQQERKPIFIPDTLDLTKTQATPVSARATNCCT
jgi:Ras-related protein Rab-7A